MEEFENTVKNFWRSNWKWFITIVFFAGMNFATIKITLDDKVTKEQVDKQVHTTINSTIIPLIERNAEDIKIMKQEAGANLDISKEIKFNLKRLMQSNGLEYIEDTDKK